MLRTLDENNMEVFNLQLETLKFVELNKEYIVNKLNGLKLDFSLPVHRNNLITEMGFYQRDISSFKDKVNLAQLMLKNYNIEGSIENTCDVDINQAYIGYLQKKFDISYDEYEVLEDFYDVYHEEYVNNSGVEQSINEIVITSKLIDKFLNKYSKDTVEYKIFERHILMIADYVNPCNQCIMDVRTNIDRYFHYNLLNSSEAQYKYQVCCVCYSQDNLDYTTDIVYALERIKDLNDMLEGL